MCWSLDVDRGLLGTWNHPVCSVGKQTCLWKPLFWGKWPIQWASCIFREITSYFVGHWTVGKFGQRWCPSRWLFRQWLATWQLRLVCWPRWLGRVSAEKDGLRRFICRYAIYNDICAPMIGQWGKDSSALAKLHGYFCPSSIQLPKMRFLDAETV